MMTLTTDEKQVLDDLLDDMITHAFVGDRHERTSAGYWIYQVEQFRQGRRTRTLSIEEVLKVDWYKFMREQGTNAAAALKMASAMYGKFEDFDAGIAWLTTRPGDKEYSRLRQISWDQDDSLLKELNDMLASTR
jgi:hypothetical protein